MANFYYSEPISFVEAPAGQAGRGIQSITFAYCRTETDVQPTAGWELTFPAVDAAKPYLWTQITYNYTTGGAEIAYTVTKNGEDGKPGEPGKDGTQITSITTTYARADNGITAPTVWYTTIAETDATLPYLWMRVIYNYSDNTSSEPQYSVTKNGKDGDNASITVAPTVIYKGLTRDLTSHKAEVQLVYNDEVQTLADTTRIEVNLNYTLTQGVHYFRLDDENYLFIEFAADEEKRTISQIIPSSTFYYRTGITNNIDVQPLMGKWSAAKINAGTPILVHTTVDEETNQETSGQIKLDTYLYLQYQTEEGNFVDYLGDSILTQIGSYIAVAVDDGADLNEFHANNWEQLTWHALVGYEQVKNLALSTSISEDQQTLYVVLSSYAAEYNGLQFTGYYKDKVVCHYILPFSLDKDLLALGNINENGDVVIADNKVAADSIAANAVIAEKIDAGAVQTEKIAAGAVSADKIATIGLQSKEQVKFDTGSPYTTQGSLISFGYQAEQAAGIYFPKFYIDQNGNAGFKGSITAEAGATFAGWTLDSASIKDSSGTMGLYHSNDIAVQSLVSDGKSPYRFFSGGIISNTTMPVFAVLADGSLYSSHAKMAGLDIANGRVSGILRIGNSEVGIKIDGENGIISSPNYSDNLGWFINKDGNAAFNNLTARGKLTSVVFEQNTMSAVGGDLYVSPTVYFSKGIEIDDTTLRQQPTEPLILTFGQAITGFGKDGLVLLNFIAELDNGEIYNYKDLQGIITELNEESVSIKIERNDLNSKNSSNIPAFIQPGCMMTSIGTTANSTYILISATKGPYIEAHAAALNDKATRPSARLGNLSDISDDDFGGFLEGYGLYSTNAYLRGQLMLPGAGITDQSSIQVADSAVRLWAGKNGNSIADSNFVVTEDGSLYANKGVFRGIIEATDGTFSGTLKTAGIVIGKNSSSQKENEFFVGYTSNPTSVDDYALRINQQGLAIWEGGLAAYSDYLNGWQGGATTRNASLTVAPYGSIDNDEKAMYPYLSLIDSQTPHLTAKGLHIFDVDKTLIGKSLKVAANKISFLQITPIASVKGSEEKWIATNVTYTFSQDSGTFAPYGNDYFMTEYSKTNDLSSFGEKGVDIPIILSFTTSTGVTYTECKGYLLLAIDGTPCIYLSASMAGIEQEVSLQAGCTITKANIAMISSYKDVESAAYQKQELGSISMTTTDESGELCLTNNNAIRIDAAALKFDEKIKISVTEKGLNFIIVGSEKE